MRTHPHSLSAIVAPSDFLLSNSPCPKDRPVPDPNQQSALLVSSLNTVTLQPTPYISFNIKTPGSQTYRNIRAFGSFTVSGLDDPETAHAFVEKFEGRALNKGREGWRACVGKEGKVRSGKGGRWWLMCKYREGMSTRVGDHVIVVGEVLDAGSDMEEGRKEQAKATGLVYLGGKYRWVGRVATRERLVGDPRKVPQPIVKRFEPSEH